MSGCIGFVWVHADSFLHSVASPFHSFVTSYSVVAVCIGTRPMIRSSCNQEYTIVESRRARTDTCSSCCHMQGVLSG